jgi:hypothetical protein
MAVKEAVAKGVHPFCITVDTMANQYLPQIFGRGHYLVLDHINSLPNKLPEIYFRLRPRDINRQDARNTENKLAITKSKEQER